METYSAATTAPLLDTSCLAGLSLSRLVVKGLRYLVGNLHSGLNQLAVVSAVQGHAADPEVAEKLWQDLQADVVRLHALCPNTLLHHLEVSQDFFRRGHRS